MDCQLMRVRVAAYARDDLLADNHKAEVFSFATVVWEMACHRRPFEDSTPETFQQHLVNGIRPPLPKRWSPVLCELMSSCWSGHADARPEFRELVPQLKALRDKEAAEEATRSTWRTWMRAMYP